MSDFKVDNIQVGSITKALSENIDGELIFRDAELPQGITLSNLVSDATFAEQIQNNVTAQVTEEIDVAVQELNAYSQGVLDTNTSLVLGLSGELYGQEYEDYLLSQGLLNGTAYLANENVFTNNIGINITPTSQLHIKNNNANDLTTKITLDNSYPDILGNPSTTYTDYTSYIEQSGPNLDIITEEGGQIRLYTTSDQTGEIRLGITDNTTDIYNTLTFAPVERVGQETAYTSGLNSVVTTSNDAFKYVREGAWINLDGAIRLVETKVSDNEIEVIGRYGTDAVNISGGGAFSYKNPLLEMEAMTITPFNDIGLGTKLPQSKLHIKEEDALYLEDENPKIHFTNKEGTFGMVSYDFTTDSFATSGYSLNLTSKKADQGASIRISSVSTDASLSTTPSGEIEFLTSPYTYTTASEEKVRATINTYGSFGINEAKPVSKLHIKQEEQILTGTVAIVSGSNLVQGSTINDIDEHVTEFDKQLTIGDTVTFLGEERTVVAISGAQLTVNSQFSNNGTNETLTAKPSAMLVDNADGNIFRMDYDGNITTKHVNVTSINAPLGVFTSAEIAGNLRVNGNIIVEGDSFELTESFIADPLTVVGYVSGGSISGALARYNGLEVYRGVENPYRIVFDENDDYFKVGEDGDEQIVATREATFTNDEIVIYESSDDRFVGSGFTVQSLLDSTRHTEVIGNGADYSYTVTHNLNTKDVHVTLRNNTTDELEVTDIVADTVNTVMIHFASPPPSNQYTVKVIS